MSKKKASRLRETRARAPTTDEADVPSLTSKDVQHYLAVSAPTLSRWRSRMPDGLPPLPFYRLGKLVRYRLADVQAFLDACAEMPM